MNSWSAVYYPAVLSLKTLRSIPKIWNSGNFFGLNTLWIYIYYNSSYERIISTMTIKEETPILEPIPSFSSCLDQARNILFPNIFLKEKRKSVD
jgi:hypothetical protein